MPIIRVRARFNVQVTKKQMRGRGRSDLVSKDLIQQPVAMTWPFIAPNKKIQEGLYVLFLLFVCVCVLGRVLSRNDASEQISDEVIRAVGQVASCTKHAAGLKKELKTQNKDFNP